MSSGVGCGLFFRNGLGGPGCAHVYVIDRGRYEWLEGWLKLRQGRSIEGVGLCQVVLVLGTQLLDME